MSRDFRQPLPPHRDTHSVDGAQEQAAYNSRFESACYHARHFILPLAGGHLTQRLFGQILGHIEQLAGHPT
jgi:hypothetical protein